MTTLGQLDRVTSITVLRPLGSHSYTVIYDGIFGLRRIQPPTRMILWNLLTKGAKSYSMIVWNRLINVDGRV